MDNDLREYFDDMIVYKNLRKSNFFSALSLPSFLRDWLLKRFADDNGEFNIEELSEYIKRVIPKKDDWISIKDRIIIDQEKVKFLAKVSVDIDIKTSIVSFSLPDFGLTKKQTIIEQHVWDSCKEELIGGKETWGIVELGYRPYESNIEPGKIKLTDFQTFCPYQIDIEYYKDVRKNFTTKEWIDVLLGAIDYNADGYEREIEKITMLTRLLPFIEKRLNLIELAPKGTGKSYIFGRVSKYGWLSSGGVMSRAKMFYDQTKKEQGLVCGNDFVALDEVQTISFTNVDEMRAALKGYMETGVFTVGSYEGTADSGVVLLGNIKEENMSEYDNMLGELPKIFQESALIDRFHGFIKGWDIPRMHDDLKVNGWALNSEYFSEIMHLLRDDISYRAIVDELVIVPPKADTRDTEAVKRICTAYVKLLFPNIRNTSEVDLGEFKKYCLRPSITMRSIIKNQLGILDIEFRGKNMPRFEIKGLNI
ncbi:BREX system Lon protease-like protein BrxL [Clostridium bowmanii]|uniref:BREX system Lon protease-like protein BrxL n=1 Tax=Clostridium bowmanii TaxID=132925 RepID=UPI001C0B3C6C|nr:BREX system Lon protease-like protein BrxL [Clostridium bowmanii]MBU3188740.1 BREX system Lon protease-like protein BrxL [Clostridium bowmanii]MCA1073325.1 BREX system Lon protease-like protein BrxL [Clostridium bowmanii]